MRTLPKAEAFVFSSGATRTDVLGMRGLVLMQRKEEISTF